jgi:16S rRNA (cytosine967-C5)-methyltransferase
LTTAVAPGVLHSVVQERRRLAPALGDALRDGGPTSAKDRLWIARSLAALLRWWGWIEPLHLPRIEEQLLLAWLLDSSELSAMARVWAARIGRRTETLTPVGDAPNWTARALGLKRFMGGRPVNADPWRLFPAWLRVLLPVPPGNETPKARRLDFLAALQTRPSVWVAVRGQEAKAIWSELREAELKPWVHRRVTMAAKLPPETDLTALESFRTGRLVQEDLASQAVGIVCDPDPGERWWDVNGENGLHALHLAALMKGKGVVVSTFDHKSKQHATALRLRRSAFHNITTRTWDGRHPPGKHASYDGVLLAAVCSGIGSWRRHPDARWTISADQIPALVARQLECLDVASGAVRLGGTLVYTVVTATRNETVEVINAFLASHPDFRLDASAHPLDDAPPAAKFQLWPQIHDCDARFIARMVRGPNQGPVKEKRAEVGLDAGPRVVISDPKSRAVLESSISQPISAQTVRPNIVESELTKKVHHGP